MKKPVKEKAKPVKAKQTRKGVKKEEMNVMLEIMKVRKDFIILAELVLELSEKVNVGHIILADVLKKLALEEMKAHGKSR